ncbi:15-hydroxyprostaglandin dehydrogenase [NAD(+)]-like [Glandiceps talaboti]
MSLTGKVALVTGAAGGIGSALVEEFLKQDAQGVYMIDTDDAKGQEVLAKYRGIYGAAKVQFCKCDVTSKEKLEAAFKECVKEFDHLDIVCNNAAMMNEYNWKCMLSVNVDAVIEGTYLAVKYMGTKNGGNGGIVINTASGAGLKPVSCIPLYAASKHAVVGFSRSVAFEPDVKDNGVRVVAVCPKLIQTDLSTGDIPGRIKYVDQYKELLKESAWIEKSDVTTTVVALIIDSTANGTVARVSRGGFKHIPPPTLD